MFLATQIVNSTGRTGENGMICWQHRSRIWDVTIRKHNLRWTKNTNVSHPISCYDENHICQSTLCHVFFVPPCPPRPKSKQTTSVWRKTSAESASTAVDSQKHPSIIMPNTLIFPCRKVVVWARFLQTTRKKLWPRKRPTHIQRCLLFHNICPAARSF